MSAISGVGPTFVFGLFFQKNQSPPELSQSIGIMEKALYFNKIGAPLAALSGIGLVMTGRYGTWLQLWILGAILIFIIITVISVPLGNKLNVLKEWVNKPSHLDLKTLPEE